MTKYIFITGGVMSGIGKGVTTASLARILKDGGFRVTAMKIDPYVNVDAGTMNPIEHGEVFVTEDGLECDQDIGNYERFLDQDMYRFNYMTTGQVYQSVINKERNLAYGGKCVEVVPHIPEEVIRRIEFAGKKTKSDFVLIEVGGTIGEYQNMLFLEAGRMMHLKMPDRVMFIMVSYLPVPKMIGEMKTKPTQYAVRSLNAAGIQPDIIIARSAEPIDGLRKQKLATFCNTKKENIISAPDIKYIYEIPSNFEKDKLGERVMEHFGIKKPKKQSNDWHKFARKIRHIQKTIPIAVIGKYFATGSFTLSDSYISIIEAIKHACIHNGYHPEIAWLDSEKYEQDPRAVSELSKYSGVIIPGGFGSRGVEGKISAIRYARKNNIPFLGICYGMQLAVVEVARSLGKMKGANTSEVDPDTKYPVINVLPEQELNIKEGHFGGSMRLGTYPCTLTKNTICKRAYGESNILERHRHRYEFNNDFRERLEAAGLKIAGVNTQKNLVEIIELEGHPFFVGTQFHPELKSRPLRPHPLFREFVKAAVKNL